MCIRDSYTQLNQYHVILETLPSFQTNPSNLEDIYVRSGHVTSTGASVTSTSTSPSGASASSGASTSLVTTGSSTAAPGPSGLSANAISSSLVLPVVTTTNGGAVPLSAIAHFEPSSTPLLITHQGQFPVVTVSFNLASNSSLGAATDAIDKVQKGMGMPLSIQTAFQGSAASFQASLTNEPLLILAALVTVYIVLGVLYESYIHPITILSTLPSAGVGAVLALMRCV